MRRRRSLGRAAFSPLKLFVGGAKGAWYDPSDYTSLFQNSAGTTPVTAVEQSVGLMLDKSQGATWVSLGTTGWVKSSGDGVVTVVGNTITITGATTTTGVTPAVNRTVRNGLTRITALYTNTGSAVSPLVYVAGSPSAPTSGVSATYVVSSTNSNLDRVQIASGSATFLIQSYDELQGNHASQATNNSRPVLRARYNNFVGTATLATQNVTTLATSYKLSFTGAGTITLSGTNVGVYSAGTNTITCTAGTLTATVVGTVTNADLRLASTATSMPAYQLVTTSTNYDTTGFLPYLVLDGSDDSFATNSINFTATDKMAVVVGVTKLSDAAQAAVAELSATIASNNGSFLLTAPNSAAANFNFSSKGTTQVDNTVVTYASPYTAVLAASGDIAGGTNSIKVNGGTATTVTSSQGTGNYGNFPLYIGRRNNATLPLNGRIYQMVVIGKTLSASELASIEAFVATKTGVTL
jgi:hypothetical protein